MSQNNLINQPFLLSREAFERLIHRAENQASNGQYIREKTNPILEFSGGAAFITIEGELLSDDAWWSYFFKTTKYSDIQEAIGIAEKSDASEIFFVIDSPGGDAAGVDETAMMIRNSSKKTTAIVKSMAASAAYWLASQANKTVATSPTSMVGSIGVLCQVVDWSKFEEKVGVVTHTIVSAKSPNKAPDISTEGGRDQIRSTLDGLLEIFAERVATGRNVSKNTVFNNFGQGDIVLARQAKEVGMIDSIENDGTVAVSQKAASKSSVDKEKYIQIGIDKERSRVVQLLEWNTNEQVRGIAVDAIKSGQSQQDIMGQLVRATNLPSEVIAAQEENVESITPSQVVDESSDEEKISLLTKQILAMAGRG